MAFDGFYIKLSSIAKLPHTDTYYACFEYKNKYKDKFNITDTLASSCIIIEINNTRDHMMSRGLGVVYKRQHLSN